MNQAIQQIRQYLVENNQSQILEIARQNKRILSYLTALTYDPDQLVAWRAIAAIGYAAEWYADRDIEYLRIHLRRLIWLLSDESGGIGWHAPEAMGEIIRARPDLLAEFIPILISIFDMEPEDAPPFKAGALWAIGRLAQVSPEVLTEALPQIFACFSDPDPQICGMAVWCISQAQMMIKIDGWDALLQDKKPVLVYRDGKIDSYTISDLAALAIKQLPNT